MSEPRRPGDSPTKYSSSIRDYFRPTQRAWPRPSKAASAARRRQLPEVVIKMEAESKEPEDKDAEDKKDGVVTEGVKPAAAAAAAASTPARKRPQTPTKVEPDDDDDIDSDSKSPIDPLVANSRNSNINATEIKLPILPSTPQAPRYRTTPATALPPTPRLLLSSPSVKNPTPGPRAPLARGTVVADSDDDGGNDGNGSDSDSSLEDLSSLLFKTASPRAMTMSNAMDVAGPNDDTPPAKRPAYGTGRRTDTAPRARLDMKALVVEAEKNHRIIQGFRLTTAADGGAGAGGAGPDAMDVDTDVAPEDGDRLLREIAGEERLDRARKALERTGTVLSRSRFYFFEPRPPVPDLEQHAFPIHAATGRWAILADSESRHETVRMGLPSMMLAKGLSLPDELFLWILNATYAEGPSPAARDAYIDLVAQCPSQINRLITAKLLDDMLRDFWAGKHLDQNEPAAISLASHQPDRYAKRDFAALVSWLKLTGAIAPYMTRDVLMHTLKRLLRMGVDAVVASNIEVHVAHARAVRSLCEVIDPSRWDDSCADVCLSLYTAFSQPSLLSTPLAVMPSTSCRVHELRRRLAIAFLFGDAGLARQHPDNTLTLASVLKRLHGDEFRITKDTDYVEMRCLVVLLNLAVDDGSSPSPSPVPPPSTTTTTTTPTPTTPTTTADEKEFNAEIDQIAQRLRAVWRGINDTGGAFTSRTDAKNTLEWVQQRLTFTVRTRRPPKRDIYDLATAKDTQAEEAALSKQQAYMKNFLRSDV